MGPLPPRHPCRMLPVLLRGSARIRLRAPHPAAQRAPCSGFLSRLPRLPLGVPAPRLSTSPCSGSLPRRSRLVHPLGCVGSVLRPRGSRLGPVVRSLARSSARSLCPAAPGWGGHSAAQRVPLRGVSVPLRVPPLALPAPRLSASSCSGSPRLSALLSAAGSPLRGSARTLLRVPAPRGGRSVPPRLQVAPDRAGRSARPAPAGAPRAAERRPRCHLPAPQAGLPSTPPSPSEHAPPPGTRRPGRGVGALMEDGTARQRRLP